MPFSMLTLALLLTLWPLSAQAVLKVKMPLRKLTATSMHVSQSWNTKSLTNQQHTLLTGHMGRATTTA